MKEKMKQSREVILEYIRNHMDNEKIRLAIIQVGDDAASSVYVRNKLKTCESVGIKVEVFKISESVSFEELTELLERVAINVKINGIILQLPLPDHLKKYQQVLLDIIPWYKDVDGLSTESIGRLWTSQSCLEPATALGVLLFLKGQFELKGKKIGIVGRSSLIGKPLTKMLLDEDTTITLYHSKSNKENLKNVFLDNEIVISGIGNTELAKYYKEPCIWVDCGIIKKEDGKLCGDAGDLKSQYITPVPGGVGTLTTACVAYNTYMTKKMRKTGN